MDHGEDDDPINPDFCAEWLKARLNLAGFNEDEMLGPDVAISLYSWFEDAAQKRLYLWIGDKEGDETDGGATPAGAGSSSGRQALITDTAVLPLPIRQGSVKEFCYVYKRPNTDHEVITKGSISKVLLIGTIKDHLLDYLLTVMNGAFIPISASDHGWPENLKKDFTGQIQKFMARLTEMTFLSRGATVLYVPPDDLSDLDKVSKDKDAVQRLESTLIHWTRQIKEVTAQQDASRGGGEAASMGDAEVAGPLDEIQFWRARNVDLSRLHAQLETPQLQRILRVLEASKSSYLKHFRALQNDISRGSIEAQANLKFLSALEEPCLKLTAASPVVIPENLPSLLHSVRMIWTISTHYNTADRITGLLRKISNEIIRRCQDSIQLEAIFAGRATDMPEEERAEGHPDGMTVKDIQEATQRLEESAACGRAWKQTYQRTAKLLARHNPTRRWDFSEGSIFAQVDAFVQRCCDLLEVCEGQLQFAAKARGIELPRFGGARAPEVIKSLNEIETSFLNNVAKLRNLSYYILDVKTTRWHDDYSHFKNQMKDLEVMYMNVITSAFEGVSTAEAAIELFDAFFSLSKRPRIKGFVEKKAIDVYNLFSQEMMSLRREFEQYRKKCLLPVALGHPTHAGTALWARGIALRLQRQMELIDTIAVHGFENSREAEVAKETYSNFQSILEGFVKQTFDEWLQELNNMDTNTFGRRLNQPLLGRQEQNILARGKGGQLESNFDKGLMKMFQEVYYWEKIQGHGIVVPYAAHEMFTHRDTLRVLREHVLRVVREYNVIIDNLAPEERRLFAHHIKTLDRRISPGIQRLTWNSQGIKEFFVRDSCRECNKVYDFVLQYKANHHRVNVLCKNISDRHMILIDKKTIYTVEEFKTVQEKHRVEIVDFLQNTHAEITDTMLATYQFFETHPQEIQREWKQYVDKMDKKVEEALKKAVKSSLQDLSKALNSSDGKRGEMDIAPLFKVHAVLKGTKMDFRPTMSQLKDMLQLICREMTMTLTVVPRLSEHLRVEKTRRDILKKAALEKAGDIAGASAIIIPDEEELAKSHKKKKSFFDEISKDDEIVRIIVQIMKGHNNCATKLQDRLKWWHNSYQPIVSQDKDAFIKRYARTERPLAVVGTDIQRYKEVQSDIQQEEFKVTICFIEADFTLLKQALVQHCQQWQSKLTGLLNQNALKELNALLDYFQINSKTLLEAPKTLDELRHHLTLFDKCKADIPSLEDRIQPVEDQYAKLAEFDVQVGDDEEAMKKSLRPALETFKTTLVEADQILAKSKKIMKAELESNLGQFQKQAAEAQKVFKAAAPFDAEATANEKAFALIQNYRSEVERMRLTEQGMLPKIELFGMEASQYKEIDDMEKDLQLLTSIWTIKEEWDEQWNAMKTGKFRDLNVDEMDTMASTYQKRIQKMKEIKQWPIWTRAKQDIEDFRAAMPLITNLRSEALRDRHWKRIKQEVAEPFDARSPDFTLNSVFQLGLPQHAELIARLADEARKEYKIETGLKDIAEKWEDVLLDIVVHKEVYYKLRTSEELFTMLEEHILSLSSMKSSQYYLPFSETVEHWEKALANISEVIELTLQVQRQWMYLENIFVGSDDIRPVLPQEAGWFDEVNAGFKQMMEKIYHEPKALKACSTPGMLDSLMAMNAKLERIQKSLDDYLERKRQEFPRFYFLSSDDLLEILGQSRDPEMVQKHIKKCFEGIKVLDLCPPGKQGNRTWEALGMVAPDGEKVKFHPKSVVIEGPVEQWLIRVEKAMKETLKRLLVMVHQANLAKGTKKEKWIKDNPGQLLITAGQIAWTTDSEAALRKIEKGGKNAMKLLKKHQTKYLAKLTDLVRKPLSKVERLKLVALITIEVHARDVQERLIQMKCENENAFPWKSQLRFELREEVDSAAAGGAPPAGGMTCRVLQTETLTPYGYEYQGNNGRLVVTPLTDKCYMTLTMALHLKRGGAPQGPAGTGKTETVKDLGKGLAKYVIVMNCSDGLDYKSLGRMFSGMAQAGCWGCFDEFNRIEVEVLSVVAQQIMTIQQALKEMPDTDDPSQPFKFLFEGHRIRLDRGCGIFITMNPGYAGRSELPDNLKSLFRPVAMMVPDMAMIAEIMLMSEGFKDAKSLAKKMVTLYQLMVQQLSKQDHYDFGLRAIRSVLNRAGSLKRADPDLPEQELLMRAIRDMNVPKFVAEDLPLFEALLSDLFPGLELPEPEYGKLQEAIEAVLDEMGLQKVPQIIKKTIQVYETKLTRHGNMIVGLTLSGKSTCWHVLQQAMTALAKQGVPDFEAVKTYVINPKSIDMNELYGSFDLQTMEWTDGILSSIMRTACQDEKPDQKWIILDGPVDTLWIESMNTVLDDNKILTLINGDRIAMPLQVSLLFEVEDLAVASPATVSRAGMVYLDVIDLGWKPYVDTWVTKQTSLSGDHRSLLASFFEKYVDQVLKARRDQCKEVVPISEVNGVMSLCRLFEVFIQKCDLAAHGENAARVLERIFVFSLIWSLGGSVDGDSRPIIDQRIREIDNMFPPTQTVYEYGLNFEKGEWIHWEERLPNPYKPSEGTKFHRILVPTVDTVRNSYILSGLVHQRFHTLCVGHTGTGKTSCVASSILQNLDDQVYAMLTINFSAQTNSLKTQNIIEGKLEKRIKNKFGPPGNRKLVCFCDDLNMPRKDTFGSQPPLELLRQWMDYGCWYDRSKQQLKYIQDMQLVAAMGPPGGGRSVISRRLESRFNLINFTLPSESQIKRIYNTLAHYKFNDFREDLKQLAEPLAAATISLYDTVNSTFLPTPDKPHYLFNMRDISRVFQGLYQANHQIIEEKESLVRMWYHENLRVFHDRLINTQDRSDFKQMVDSVCDSVLQMRLKDICKDQDGDPIFASFSVNNPDMENAPYDQITDAGLLRQFMQLKLEEYNEQCKGAGMDLVLFRDAIEHCCRIHRVISLPKGNALLVGVGGSGRHSMTRLASFISEYDCFQIEISKNYRHVEFQEDLKKLYHTAGVKGKATTFLFSDTEIVTESFIEDVNNLLGSGEVPNLFVADELSAIRAELEKPAKEAGVPLMAEPLYDFLLSRVRENLHVVICISPIGTAFRNYCRMYPALVNNTTIDWFLPWPADALSEVAIKFLSAPSDEVSIEEEQRKAIADIFGQSHMAVIDLSDRMMAEMKRKNYVTPTHYLELVKGYVSLLVEKNTEIGEMANKLRNGLDKLTEARIQVEEMGVDLEKKKDIVAKKQKECQDLLVVIVEKRMSADEQKKQVEADSERIGKEEAETKILADDARRDLAKAMPALEAAIDALEKLDKKAISEVKAYSKPPDLVMKTMAAVMTVMDKTPSWQQAKLELNDPGFLTKIKNFDKDNISDSTLKKIIKYTKDPGFTPEAVTKVSSAAGALCLWVHAMRLYSEVYREVEPKRLKLKMAEETLAKKQSDLKAATERLKDIQERVQALKFQYDESMRTKDELTASAEELKVKLERAEKLVTGLAGEKDRWEESVQAYNEQISYLPGDCLVAAAFLSYAGPFNSTYRNDLVTRHWVPYVKEYSLPQSPNFEFAGFMSKPTDVRQWNIQGLPTDRFSTENGVLVTRTKRWPLMIDPQDQANKWIRKMEASSDLKVIDPKTKDFMRLIERAIELGKPILMERVQEELDPSLEPVLSKQIIDSGGSLSIKIGDNTLDYNPAFMLYLTTKMTNPHYTPEVSTKTTIVNFIVVEAGLTDQLLGIVVMKEEPRLEEQKGELVVKVADGKKRLKDLEDEILRLLSVSQGSLIDDIDLINTLQESKTISEEVTQQLEISEQTMKKIDQAREAYRPCGRRASLLYFVLSDLTSIDPMYQFSLDAYNEVFIKSIDVSREKNPMTSSVEERLGVLNQWHTLAVYRYACRALFEKHKLLLSVHMASKVLTAEGQLSASEYAFFLRGGQVLDRSSQTPNPSPDWIKQPMWDGITELDKLESFKGFPSSFEQTLREWKKWYMSAEPEKEGLPGEWDTRLDPLQKLLLVRCLRPDRALPAATNFVAAKMDPKFVDPPPPDLESFYEASSATVPMIFVLSPGVDPAQNLMSLANATGIRVASISLGQGQSVKAERMLRDGAAQGFWVFLANCHLSLSWLPELEKLIDQIVEEKPRPNFRLWMSSEPTPKFPIALLQRSMKMTTEPPRGLKANLQRLLVQVSDEEFSRVRIQADKYRRLFFNLCWLHSVVLERRKFKTLGWNVPYDFNDSDFSISDNILAIYIEQYSQDVPWEAIRYLIADASYGGRVTDDRDLRLLKVYCNEFFSPAAVQAKFMLSTLQTYFCPEDLSLSSFRNYARELPLIDSPEAFGQHVNAEISSQIADTNALLANLVSIQPQGGAAAAQEGGGAVETKDDAVLRLCTALEEKMPEDIDYREIYQRNESDPSPLRVVLLQEIQRYNKLLRAVRSSLASLQKGIKGLVVISEELEEVMQAVYEGKVPKMWSFAYPSLKPLLSWVADLTERIEQLNRWGLEGAPRVFWLGGFTYPTGFLTALLQQSARKNVISIDALSFDFVVQATSDEGQVHQPPKEGAMVKRMILEGAKWDYNAGHLSEPEPMELFADMPIVHFRPVAKKKGPSDDMYGCPLYLYPIRTGTRERPSFMITVDLKSGSRDPSYWVKRGTALLLSKAD
ncbi:unnamed protein product [Vitrella brassicaformis CCMP3155]|uniref:Dynein-1, subspecies f n=15 Tax=Vitrella brassicaformis TaxID=1169539 RepID=A0A0G4EN59_VITBC|nr:unnamed protein product [Vitrella brassicaformis CCMP3155]|eukprot:CEL98551.1 unnamed protein product [Vitrella brassicaformis CCMP3155]